MLALVAEHDLGVLTDYLATEVRALASAGATTGLLAAMRDGLATSTLVMQLALPTVDSQLLGGCSTSWRPGGPSGRLHHLAVSGQPLVILTTTPATASGGSNLSASEEFGTIAQPNNPPRAASSFRCGAQRRLTGIHHADSGR